MAATPVVTSDTMQLLRPSVAVCVLCLAPLASAQAPEKPGISLRQPADATYPSGQVVLEYTLDRQADRVEIAIRNGKGIIVAEWAGVANSAGPPSTAGRFVLPPEQLTQGSHAVRWDLHAGGYLVAGRAGSAPSYSEGPLAPPGAYVVQLTATGQTVRQNLGVVAKPALGPSLEADLAARFDLALRIRGRAAAASSMVRQVREMAARVAKGLEGTPTPAQKEAGSALTSRLAALEGVAGQAVSSASGAWPLQDALAALAAEVEAGGRPTDAQASRYVELGNILQARIIELNALISGSYAKFEQGQPVLPSLAGAVFGGAAVQFDSKGVDFDPWVRAYVAALKQRWVIPPSASGTKGRVVIALVMRKSGVVSGVEIVGPSTEAGFNESAQAAVLAARPAPPLPDAFPDDACPMRVTFYFNELPPARVNK
jgi:TonB family protein